MSTDEKSAPRVGHGVDAEIAELLDQVEGVRSRLGTVAGMFADMDPTVRRTGYGPARLLQHQAGVLTNLALTAIDLEQRIRTSAREVLEQPRAVVDGLFLGLPHPESLQWPEPDPNRPVLTITINHPNRLSHGDSTLELDPFGAYCLGVLMHHSGRYVSGAELREFGGFDSHESTPNTTMRQAALFTRVITQLSSGLAELLAVDEPAVLIARESEGRKVANTFCLDPNIVFVTGEPLTRDVAEGSLTDRQAELMSGSEVIAWLRGQLPGHEISEQGVLALLNGDVLVKPRQGPGGEQLYSAFARQRLLEQYTSA